MRSNDFTELVMPSDLRVGDVLIGDKGNQLAIEDIEDDVDTSQHQAILVWTEFGPIKFWVESKQGVVIKLRK